MAVTVTNTFPPDTFGDTCLLCKCAVPSPSRPHDRILDLGVYLLGGPDEGSGNLCICETCAIEISSLIGCMPTRQGEVLLARNRELQAKIETYEQQRDNLRSYVS